MGDKSTISISVSVVAASSKGIASFSLSQVERSRKPPFFTKSARDLKLQLFGKGLKFTCYKDTTHISLLSDVTDEATWTIMAKLNKWREHVSPGLSSQAKTVPTSPSRPRICPGSFVSAPAALVGPGLSSQAEAAPTSPSRPRVCPGSSVSAPAALVGPSLSSQAKAAPTSPSRPCVYPDSSMSAPVALIGPGLSSQAEASSTSPSRTPAVKTINFLTRAD